MCHAPKNLKFLRLEIFQLGFNPDSELRRKTTPQMYFLSINKIALVCMSLFTKAAGHWIIMESALSNSFVCFGVRAELRLSGV